MKRKHILIVVAMIALLMGILLFFLLRPAEWSLRDPLAHYLQATSVMPANQSIQTHILSETQITSKYGTFTESSDQILALYYTDGILQQAYANEEYTAGNQTINNIEVLQGDTIYIDLDGSLFSGSSSLDEFMTEHAPAIMLNPDNYQTVTGVTSRENSTIIFSDAIFAEPWALPDEGKLISASGCALLSKDDTLLESTYTVKYKLSELTVSKTFRVILDHAPMESVQLIVDPDRYTELSDPYSLKQLERMCSYLLQAQTLQSKYTEYIFCQAFGDERTRLIQMDIINAEPWCATLQTNLQLNNSSRAGDSTEINQLETFENGAYEKVINGSLSENSEMTEESFRSYCRNILVGTVILPTHITGVNITDDGDVCYMEFTANDTLAENISADACRTLYQDPMLLDNMASHHVTDQLSCFFSYNKRTGLPLSSGILYNGIYNISDLPYRLEFRVTQTYDLAIE